MKYVDVKNLPLTVMIEGSDGKWKEGCVFASKDGPCAFVSGSSEGKYVTPDSLGEVDWLMLPFECLVREVARELYENMPGAPEVQFDSEAGERLWWRAEYTTHYSFCDKIARAILTRRQ